MHSIAPKLKIDVNLNRKFNSIFVHTQTEIEFTCRSGDGGSRQRLDCIASSIVVRIVLERQSCLSNIDSRIIEMRDGLLLGSVAASVECQHLEHIIDMEHSIQCYQLLRRHYLLHLLEFRFGAWIRCSARRRHTINWMNIAHSQPPQRAFKHVPSHSRGHYNCFHFPLKLIENRIRFWLRFTREWGAVDNFVKTSANQFRFRWSSILTISSTSHAHSPNYV